MSSEKASLDGLRINRPTMSKASSRPGWLLPVGVVALAAAGLAAWFIAGPKAVQVETFTVQATVPSGKNGARAQSTPLLNASGYVTARREATVSSKITGKVVDIKVEEGMKVEEGQELAKLDDTNVQASLKLAEAQLESARRAIEETRPTSVFAEQEVKRFTDLAATKAASMSDLNKAQAEARSLQAKLARQQSDLTVAERELATWTQQVDDTIIRAPFPGVVTSKNAQPGEMISPMSSGGFTRTGICTLVDMSSLEIEVDVSESYINRVVAGQPVEATLDAYSDWKIPARVVAIIPTADRQKATVKVRVGFDKLDPRILPEMGVKVAFHAAQEEAKPGKAPAPTIVIPKSALHEDGGKNIVWIIESGRVERRAVSVSLTQGDNSTIAAGLSNGERVVVSATAPLKEGTRVKETKS
jgi:HlyD family secretion protein